MKNENVSPRWSVKRCRPSRTRAAAMICVFLCSLAAPVRADPPPAPSSTSKVGDTVTNPATGAITTVAELIVDPKDTPTAGTTAFVRTTDQYVFLVKGVGGIIYNADKPPLAFHIVSADSSTNTVQLDADPPGGVTAPLNTRLTKADYDLLFQDTGTPPVVTPVIQGGVNGWKQVMYGNGGSSGRNGALFVPPSSGDNGDPGPTNVFPPTSAPFPPSDHINGVDAIGLEVGSVGGSGGKGGNSYASFWSGRDGGDGGKGGDVTVTINPGFQVASSGTDKYGIFAYSRSGQAGNGGGAFAAPEGGTGGHSSDGGTVTVTNGGQVITTGTGGFGIYGLSVSNNGGNGGSQWGLVGQSGDGGAGGNGGLVSITNDTTGSISTSGGLAHGILAQSIGGTGGSSGESGNLLVSLNGGPDNGGNGGPVSVTNKGSIATTGPESRGIFAQSAGGGGGTGGSNGGLIALAGSGSHGGSGDVVTVTNERGATITTSGFESDAIFASSAGGSGGSGSNATGLIALGGSGDHGGDGGPVTVVNRGTISTTGDSSRGIFAQSIGGGGGDGGNSGGIVSVGGSGKGGGIGKAVNVTNGGTITTQGADSAAVYVESVGGGGGHGGSAGSVSAFGGLSIGGNGGTGGDGGNVSLTLEGVDANTASLVQTKGDRSPAMYAQSVGGGGGSGGGAVQVTSFSSIGGSVAVGGNGNAAGDGGIVTLSKGTGASLVQTSGADSPAMFLQSVGGGGGDGGYAISVAATVGATSDSLSLAVGGKGASAGVGGTVAVGAFTNPGLDGNGKVLPGTLTTTGFNGSVLTSGDRSPGFIAQSVGGGGGNGGLAVSAAANASLIEGGSVGVALGGRGDKGGDGGTVSAGTEGDITTEGISSPGLIVQSVGGGGGNGGGSVAAALSGSGGVSGSVSVSLGGAGKTGGAGGTVSAATQSGTIRTYGDFSNGIVVQSVGGGGGNGGFSASGSGAGAGLVAAGVAVGLGGAGDSGGDAGRVKANLQSDVNTAGDSAAGVIVQSVGGGGGNGGVNVSAAGAGAGGAGAAITVGLGGSGSAGGRGDRVDATSSGTITTTGDSSAGFVAQSLGGGGGNGGFNVAAAGAGAGAGSGALTVGVGGSGGTGTNAGDVFATVSGQVTTSGADSVGVMAQSLGGGGGNGGFNVSASGAGAGVGSGAATVGVGGKGGAAGDGSLASLTVLSDVQTSGDGSIGVLAQSIGGGGGNGGFNVSASGSGAGVGSGAVTAGVGGGGDSGGNGGAASTSVTANTTTYGQQSTGILVQSLGGGGGNGGFSVTATGSGAGVGSGALSVGVGGKGSKAGGGSTATLTVTGDVTTTGNESRGVIVQSIGGGGGNGGLSVVASGSGAGVGSGAISTGVGGSGAGGGDAGHVSATVTGDITTSGSNAEDFIAQSLGGGGGNGALNVSAAVSGAGVGSGAVSVGVGGNGGKGGNADTVDASADGTLTTNGDYSTAFLAQAVGGGGGNGGGTVSAAGSGGGVGSGAVSVGVGGGGGSAGDGGAAGVDLAVTATAKGSIQTYGQFSGGFVAQSVGGGGGNGGYSVTADGSGAGTGSGSVAVGVGGGGAKGGDGKGVNATIDATVHTRGSDSIGVLAQSVGGGGGNGGFSVTVGGSGAGTGSGDISVGLGGSGDKGGVGGNVVASATNTIQTEGDRSAAFVAQSVGGGGGNGGFNVTVGGSGAGTGSGAIAVGLGGSGAGGGNAGTVTASTSAMVTTLGNTSIGILAQSAGGGGGNGGFNVTAAGSGGGTGSGAVGVGLGGSAGAGGNGSTVGLTVKNDVRTGGDNSGAVVAQSVGGGGGTGGFNVSGVFSGGGTGSGAVSIGIGGTGGGGGDGGTVMNTVTGNVLTLGTESPGITTQSLGGGGGSGGFNVSGTITAAKTGSGSLAVGVGGFGGGGGDSVGATSSITGGVTTLGALSPGIITASQGGGGGNGGMNVTADINLTKEGGGALGVGVGGFGGRGGNAGDVMSTVTTTAGGPQIVTYGPNSTGVVAQSMGGGGGNGGMNVTGVVNITGKSGAAIGIGVGGFGGGAGSSGKVTVNATADITTYAGNSNGLLAQSVGGGGGNGGLDVTGSLAISKPAGGTSGTTVATSVGVGGFGGGGGNGGDVDVTYQGTIIALSRILNGAVVGDVSTGTVKVPGVKSVNLGDGADGLVAQSIGGGGGMGGVNVSSGISYAAKDSDGQALLVGVGGFGGVGGNAGNVTVGVTGSSITSTGGGRSAILASSVGGGGGNGGYNVSGGIVTDSPIIFGVGGYGGNGGTGGNVSVTATTTDLFTTSQFSNITNGAGLMAQSLGGGGGNGGFNISGGFSFSKEKNVPSVTFGIGGVGGDGAVSGDVDVTASGLIGTGGSWTHGIFAQSVAGGGGNGALNVTGEVNLADSKNSGGNTDVTIVGGIGGFGGDGADAGKVSVASSGVISTFGDYSRGIFAQSVGGGGGTGGMNITSVYAKNSSPIILGVGGFGSGGGNGGAVSVTRGTASTPAGRISTAGTGANGIEASSLGGGGGDAGMNFQFGWSSAGSSNGPDVSKQPKQNAQHPGVEPDLIPAFEERFNDLEQKAPADDQDAKDANKQSAFAAQLAIGGAGGSAGNGAAVTVDNHSDIETFGADSHGILAQSIGGGGGNASLNIGLVYDGKSPNNKGVNLAIGGGPGDGGTGSTVEVTQKGSVTTHGDDSYGVLAQSIGGGGGNAGMNLLYTKADGGKLGVTIGRIGGTGGSAGDVSLTSDGVITTSGDRSYGLLAQSIGNGGGNSGSSMGSVDLPKDKPSDPNESARAAKVSVGLEGGQGGFAGNVSLSASGQVTTSGEGAHAIFAQSIGGGGGTGGTAIGEALKSSGVTVAVGGSGGKGGTAGTVDVDSSAQVHTAGDRSVGILAQSVGGAGGLGGGVYNGRITGTGSVSSISVGGFGGEGMTSGGVTVDNRGIVITQGESSYGVLAQSVGGGGGSGGLVINEVRNSDAKKATQIAISVGGFGGDGATSGDVLVTNTGGIGTNGLNAAGIFAQSVGGGGGNARNVITGAMSGQGAGDKLSVGIGGNGGTGGAAGDVTVLNVPNEKVDKSGLIITSNHYAPGILAMSIGGGGGTGSTTITTNRSAGTNSGGSLSAAISMGGTGGTGGTGGGVSVYNAGTITTYGYQSHGVAAFSIGGGGGAGGMSIVTDLSPSGDDSDKSKEARTSTISVGGFGGTGNRAGDVRVINAGTINVHGDSADGVYAQSVGGGGGDGGFAAALSAKLLSSPISKGSLLNIGVGGRGGAGGDGGNVFVEHSGTISSYGANSYGIFAQSVGGGGGHVGFSVSNPFWMAADAGLSIALGGRDASSGDPGTVTVKTTGTINMYGANSQAQFTQAVSGGGGSVDLYLDASQTAVSLGQGGFDLPDNRGIVQKAVGALNFGAEQTRGAIGTAIDATHVGDAYTWSKESIGALIQSIGGGGGNGNETIVLGPAQGIDLDVALGAKETTNSNGGNVTMSRTGNLQTAGASSQGVSLQSIGGGGGRALIDVTTLSADGLSTAPSSSTATVGLGADPSFENNGGNLDLTVKGSTVTAGDYSPGLVLQSIGAGGGQTFLSGLKNATINIGAADGSTGNGGNIKLTNTGTIATGGRLSDGVVLQSIGGGGGYVITDLQPGAVTVNPRASNSGNGGNISFTQDGDVIAGGDHSRAVLVQSLGGGGGVVDGVFVGSTGGPGAGGSLDLRFTGNVLATGVGSTAIFAQSDGRNGVGDITIDLAAGKSVVGGTNGAGIAIVGSANNTVLNHGLLTTAAGAGGNAITGTSGNTTVDNSGTIIGSVDLGGGDNNLINRPGAWVSSGSTMNLGSGKFTNSGTFDPGGDSLKTTMLTGNFVQTGTPTWFLDIGEVGASDGLVVSGRAELGSSVTTVNLHEAATPLKTGSYTLLSASRGVAGGQFNFGTMAGAMPIGKTFTLDATDTALNLNLRPSTGIFAWNGGVSSLWSDPFVNGSSNWTRPGGDRVYGTPGAGTDVLINGASTGLGADFTIGSLAGSGGVLLDSHSLATGADGASTTWAGTIWGTGNLTKMGSGVFTLTGVNQIDGSTIVAGGGLLVNGWLAGNSVQVLKGGLLGGNGVVSSPVTVGSGGTISPGASMGTLGVNGDVSFQSGSTYSVETDATGRSDLMWATGAVSGSGATVRVQSGIQRYHPINMFEILNAKSVDPGIFSNATSDTAYLDPSLQYNDGNLLLTLRRNDVDFRSTGTRGNQAAVAGALNGLVRTAVEQMAGAINAVYDLSNDQAQQAMGSMSGVVYQHVASTTFADSQSFMDVTMTHLGNRTSLTRTLPQAVVFDNANASTASSGQNHGAWISGVGGLTRLVGSSVDPSARVSTPGFAAGYDVAAPDVTLGVSFGQSSSDLELDQAADRNTSRLLHVAGYGRYTHGSARLAMTLGGSSSRNDTTRSVTDGVSSYRTSAVYGGINAFSRIEYGRTFTIGSVNVEPQAGFQYIHLNVDGFTEQGAGALDLMVPGRHLSSSRSVFGTRAEKTFKRSSGAASVWLEGRALWSHEFNPLEDARMRFSGDNADNPFYVTAPARIHNSTLVGASFAADVFSRFKFVTSVDADLGSAIRLWTASGGLRAEW